jgi:hypothetical protein
MAEEVPQVIYTGPSNKKLGLRNRAIYTSPELPAHLKALVETNSALAHLFVPLERWKTQRHVAPKGPVVTLARKPIAPIKLGPPIKKK